MDSEDINQTVANEFKVDNTKSHSDENQTGNERNDIEINYAVDQDDENIEEVLENQNDEDNESSKYIESSTEKTLDQDEEETASLDEKINDSREEAIKEEHQDPNSEYNNEGKEINEENYKPEYTNNDVSKEELIVDVSTASNLQAHSADNEDDQDTSEDEVESNNNYTVEDGSTENNTQAHPTDVKDDEETYEAEVENNSNTENVNDTVLKLEYNIENKETVENFTQTDDDIGEQRIEEAEEDETLNKTNNEEIKDGKEIEELENYEESNNTELTENFDISSEFQEHEKQEIIVKDGNDVKENDFDGNKNGNGTTMETGNAAEESKQSDVDNKQNKNEELTNTNEKNVTYDKINIEKELCDETESTNDEISQKIDENIADKSKTQYSQKETGGISQSELDNQPEEVPQDDIEVNVDHIKYNSAVEDHETVESKYQELVIDNETGLEASIDKNEHEETEKDEIDSDVDENNNQVMFESSEDNTATPTEFN